MSVVKNRSFLFLIVCALSAVALLGCPAGSQAADGTVKVFILAGQSNMEGKARNALLDYQAEDPKTKDLFKHFRKDGKWLERDDVFIKFLNRHCPLTVGYGSPGCTGSELEFGWMMGDRFEEPVLLIKAAEEMYPNWSKNPDWGKTGSDRPYHYYGSAIWYTRIGHAAGEAMLELLPKK